jgi:gluconolactonase
MLRIIAPAINSETVRVPMRSVIIAALTLLASPAAALAQALTTPAIPGVVAAGTAVEVIKEDVGGTEGPIGLPDGSVVYTGSNVINRVAPDGTISPYIAKTNGANGLSMDARGRLYATETGNDPAPRIAIIWPRGEERVVADKYQGKPLIRPNDLIVDAKGGVYFTDPAPRPERPGDRLSTLSHVYYVRPDGTVVLLDNRMRRPNGIQLSPDGRTLYVADTILETIIAFDVQPDGSVTNGRVFATYQGTGPEGSGGDGMAVDAEGRLYSASINGVQVFSPRGEHLGTLQLPRQPQNVAFAGPGRSYLYVVGRGGVYRVKTQTEGVKSRAK